MHTRLIAFSTAFSTIVLLGLVATAHADHGFDGKSLSGTSSTWDCQQINMPSDATSTEIYSLAGGTGDADLYVYKWTGSAWTQICASTSGSNQENCDAQVPDGGGTYSACIDGYSSTFTGFQLLAGYSSAGNTGNATQAGDGSYYINYFKDNLFLGLAYHRVGCLSDTGTTVSDQDYDGYSEGNYCRKGEAWDGAKNHGAKFMDTECGGGACYFYIGSTLSASTAKANDCGNQANNQYGTANYARRSTTCSYNILTNCNSDCWVRKFSNCMGYQIPIASPCM